MALQGWRFSAKLAWQDWFMRWTAVCMSIFVLGMSGYFLDKLVPIGLRTGVLALHYTVYLGIDGLNDWPWIIALPASMIVALAANILLSYGIFRRDHLAARALMGVITVTGLVWSVACFFLIMINV